jgi:hypothetical protein
MPAETIPFAPAPMAPAAEAKPDAAGDRLLIGIPMLSWLTSLSTRQLRRMDCTRDIPGRVQVGRRVLFQTEIVRAWVQAGLPEREAWLALQRRTGRR